MPEPARILVVDDDRRICELLVETLGAIGYQAEGAFNARTALKKIDTEKFDLVISDIVMPEISGIELLAELQKKKAGLPVVMITGNVYEDFLQGARSAGAAALLTKPFRISQIEQAMEEVLGKKADAVVVLVVEDDPIFLEFLGDSLKTRGYAPLKACNAAQALKFAKEYPVRFAILDLNLPDLHGVELLNRLKRENPYLPVALITGQSFSEAETTSAGAEWLLKKPFKLEELYRAIESVHPANFQHGEDGSAA